MVGLGDEDGLRAAGAVAVGAEDLQLVHALHVEPERALRAVDLPLERVAAAEREPRRLDRADRAAIELDDRLDRVVDPAAGDERLDQTGKGCDLADEEPGEVDDVRRQVADRAAAGVLGAEAPRVEAGILGPVLEVARPEVADLAELAGLDQLAGEPDGWHEAVVEAAEVLDAGRGDARPDLVRLVGVAAERLLAEDVLAGLGRRDRRLGVHGVRSAVVEEADRRVGHDVAPVGRPALVAVAVGGLGDRRLVAAGDRDQPGQERRRPGDVAYVQERARMRLAHEGVAEHPDADLTDVAARGHGRRYYGAAVSGDGAVSALSEPGPAARRCRT